ncbi:MAG: hypothetical protein KGM24_10420 [Elusimicrobia bacterium]|nr:hypothetical protein [Elusimicrobiota bacterium]
MIAPLLLLASLAAAQSGAPVAEPPPSVDQAAEAGPVGAPTVAVLKERFLAATNDDERAQILEEIARTRPVSGQDVSALFDLFSRYPNPELRKEMLASLALVPRDSPQLEPLFITYLKQPEPESQLFGIDGAYYVRSAAALPLIRKIAKKRLSADVSALNVLADRNEWWAQYEALRTLARWRGDEAYKLILKKSEESALVARLLGRYYWRKAFPKIQEWARSDRPTVRQRALEAAGAEISVDDARATRAKMIAMVQDDALDYELRHRLALKAGACSTDAEVPALIVLHDKAPDDRTRLLWAGAVFASRQPAAVPLLVRYATSSTDSIDRKGARSQLVEMLGEKKTDELLEASKSVKK